MLLSTGIFTHGDQSNEGLLPTRRHNTMLKEDEELRDNSIAQQLPMVPEKYSGEAVRAWGFAFSKGMRQLFYFFASDTASQLAILLLSLVD